VSRLLLAAAAASIAAAGLAGCGERGHQVVNYKQGVYQGKADSKPWDNAPLAYGTSKWTQGDEKSWETQIKGRQLSQNEDKRIYQQ
jgi:hypothetical protein